MRWESAGGTLSVILYITLESLFCIISTTHFNTDFFYFYIYILLLHVVLVQCVLFNSLIDVGFFLFWISYF